MKNLVGSSILTFTGKNFDLFNPRAQDIDIVDIAHALSNLCRFTGHTREFYSVAQHSVLVSQIVPDEHAIPALLHDAAEAYINDLSTVLKIRLDEYKKVEAGVEAAIQEAFGIVGFHKCIKDADLRALLSEKRDLMPPSPDFGVTAGHSPLAITINPMPPAMAKKHFLDRASALGLYSSMRAVG